MCFNKVGGGFCGYVGLLDCGCNRFFGYVLMQSKDEAN